MDRRSAVRKRRSGDIAAKRLKFLLAADKTGFPPETLAMLKDDLFRVIVKYMDVEPGQVETHIEHAPCCAGGSFPVLHLSMPVRSFRLKGTF